MPHQELFFEQSAGDCEIQVLKTYDQSYAREVFDDMNESARMHLWKSLGIHENFEAADVPRIHTLDGADFLWDQLVEAAREDGNLLSFFVVIESKGALSKSLYVGPDWPSAEVFAKGRLDVGLHGSQIG